MSTRRIEVTISFTLAKHRLLEMGVTLYHFPPSAPSRCALLVAKALGIDVDVQIVDLFAKEQLKEDFVKVLRNTKHMTYCDLHLIILHL